MTRHAQVRVSVPWRPIDASSCGLQSLTQYEPLTPKNARRSSQLNGPCGVRSAGEGGCQVGQRCPGRQASRQVPGADGSQEVHRPRQGTALALSRSRSTGALASLMAASEHRSTAARHQHRSSKRCSASSRSSTTTASRATSTRVSAWASHSGIYSTYRAQYTPPNGLEARLHAMQCHAMQCNAIHDSIRGGYLDRWLD